MSNISHFFHATSRENAGPILLNGFEGGWGDAGFGVYTFASLAAAQDYASAGGWEGNLEDPVILMIAVMDTLMDYVDVDPAWPNPEDYEDVRWHRMDPDTPEALWYPNISLIPD